MKLLKDFDVFENYYNLDTEEFCRFANLQKTIGIYKILNGIMSGFLVEDGKLYFFQGAETYLMTEHHKVLLEKENETETKFSLYDESGLLIRFLYLSPSAELNVSPFGYIEEEDFNWGVFIANIVNNQTRQKNYVMISTKNS